jgi:hypothetical protein
MTRPIRKLKFFFKEKMTIPKRKAKIYKPTISDNDAETIRSLGKQGMTSVAIAEIFGVTPSCVKGIRKYRSHKPWREKE